MVVLDAHEEHGWVVEGCSNFRDVGGCRTESGATVRRGRLFRSDSLAAATEQDCDRLVRCGLRTVIDLRSTAERELTGVFRADGVRVEHVPLADLLAADAGRALWNNPSLVAQRYYALCVEGRHAVAEVLAVLTDPGAYPAVVHCTVGKDRTGVVMALMLRALGVDQAAVVSDYALSGAGALRLVQRLRRELDPEILEPYLPALLSAEPATIRGFLSLVDERFGSARGYFSEIDMDRALDDVTAALLD
jgi:protein-tyrosine phosphatase